MIVVNIFHAIPTTHILKRNLLEVITHTDIVLCWKRAVFGNGVS